jgi:protein-L-isoaspartate O-methyltransferase
MPPLTAAAAVHAQGPGLARLVELTQPQPEWRVLDVATGAGHTAFAFAPFVREVTAVDITTPCSPPPVTWAGSAA